MQIIGDLKTNDRMPLMRTVFLEFVYRHSPIEMILWGVVAIGLWTALAIICKKNEKRWKVFIWTNSIVLIVNLLFVIKYTLLRESHSRNICMIPFYSFGFPRISDRYNTVVANALLFLPIGLSMPYVLTFMKGNRKLKRQPVRFTIIFSFLFSFCIEVFQFVFGLGLCETDDIIFNTLGAGMGTLAFIIMCYVSADGVNAWKQEIEYDSKL